MGDLGPWITLAEPPTPPPPQIRNLVLGGKIRRSLKLQVNTKGRTRRWYRQTMAAHPPTTHTNHNDCKRLLRKDTMQCDAEVFSLFNDLWDWIRKSRVLQNVGGLIFETGLV